VAGVSGQRPEAGLAIEATLDMSTANGEQSMKHFLLEGEHIVPFEKRAPELIAAHRQFLQQGYDQGRFLLSGPSIPPKGGILIARAESLEELNEFLAEEPYCRAKVMRFSRITEFDPVQHQPILNDWFGKR
jgi:uncharacterized protein YciI